MVTDAAAAEGSTSAAPSEITCFGSSIGAATDGGDNSDGSPATLASTSDAAGAPSASLLAGASVAAKTATGSAATGFAATGSAVTGSVGARSVGTGSVGTGSAAAGSGSGSAFGASSPCALGTSEAGAHVSPCCDPSAMRAALRRSTSSAFNPFVSSPRSSSAFFSSGTCHHTAVERRARADIERAWLGEAQACRAGPASACAQRHNSLPTPGGEAGTA